MGRIADPGTDGRGISETRIARVILHTFCKHLAEELGSTQELNVLPLCCCCGVTWLACFLASILLIAGHAGVARMVLSAPRVQQRQSRYPLVGHIPLTCLPENG